MEIIVNSTEFAKAIKKAFEVNAHCIKYYAGQGNIIFGTTKYQSDVEFGCEKRYPKNDETVTFNHLKMAKLMYFLNDICCQPAVIEIEDDFISVDKVIVKF